MVKARFHTWIWGPILFAVACGGPDETEPLPPLSYSEVTEDGIRVEYTDTDQDGTPEVIKYFEPTEPEEEGEEPGEYLARTEIDLNGDGSTNLVRVYGLNGDLLLEEMDGNFDGRADHTVHWEDGLIMRTERDEDHDGVVDVFRYYREGFLTRVLRDRDGNTEVDMWSYYDRRGLARVGYDSNGDGAADYWTRRDPR